MNVAFTFTDPYDIPAGATRGFELTFDEPLGGRVKLQVDASRRSRIRGLGLASLTGRRPASEERIGGNLGCGPT